MAIFYDWRDRTGKGWKPWREQIKELRSPLFIGLGILFLLIGFSIYNSFYTTLTPILLTPLVYRYLTKGENRR